MTYERYTSSSLMNKTPSEQYRSNFQALMTQQIDNAYNWYDICVEEEFGTQEYYNEKVRVTGVINPDTGTKLSDDWKQIIFKDEPISEMIMGRRYKYYDNVWLILNTENYGSATYNCVIRRCNNTLSMKLTDGSVHKEPCAIENTLNSSNLYFNNSVNIAQGTIVVWIQINKYTKYLNVNDRFILGYNKAFKVKSIMNYLSNKTFDANGATLMKVEMQQDSILSSDDFINGTTNSTPNDLTLTGNYIDVEPDDNYIAEDGTTIFTCYYYVKNEKRTNEFVFTIVDTGIPSSSYEFTIIDGNSFSIKNKKKSVDIKLEVSCANANNLDMYIIKEIELGGAY